MLLVGDELDNLFQLQTSLCDLGIESIGVGWQSITIGVESVSNSLKFRGYYAVISSLIHDHEDWSFWSYIPFLLFFLVEIILQDIGCVEGLGNGPIITFCCPKNHSFESYQLASIYDTSHVTKFGSFELKGIVLLTSYFPITALYIKKLNYLNSWLSSKTFLQVVNTWIYSSMP